jgi:hypothetical protein
MTAYVTDRLAADVYKTIVDIPMPSYLDGAMDGRGEGLTNSHKNQNVVSGALISKGSV